MIKIRLMGEREDIKIIIENISHINDGRIYMEVEKKDAV